MPSGTGAVNLRNLPNTAYEVNPAEFFALTEKNEFPPINFPLPTASNYTEQQLLQVGVVSKLRLIFKGNVVAAATSGMTVTPTFKWPYGLISNLQFSGNGQNNFVSCSGYDLFIRQLVQNRAYVDQYTIGSTGATMQGSGTGATTPVQIQWEIPLAMDDTTLIGSLYAQSEATNLTFTLTTEAMANLFTLAGVAPTISVTGTIYVEEIFFDVPYSPQKPGTLVIPDLTVLHGLISNNNPVAGLSETTTQLYRVNGQLERLFFYIDNNNALVSTANIAQARLVYGGSQTPINYQPMDHLKVINNQDYRVQLPDGVYCIDLVKDNPARDQILLEGVTNLRLVLDTVTTFTPNAAAKVHFVQETLFA
jgi:hypothetical protein